MTDWRNWMVFALMVLVIFASFEIVSVHNADLALQKVLLQQGDKIAQLDNTIRQRDTAAQVQVTHFEKLRHTKMTPLQAIKEAPQIVPNLPVPIPQPLPDAPTVQIPVQDIPAFRDALLAGQECKVQLGACQGDLRDVQSMVDAVGKERDAVIRAEKGGSFFHRLKHDLIVIGVSAGVGYSLGHKF